VLRILGILVAVLVVLAAGGAWYVYGLVSDLQVEQVGDDVWVIFGVGGNVGVLRTAEGAVVVDTMSFTVQGEGIRALAEELAGGPVVALINSHYHNDHTHGNPAFTPGTRVIATTRTLAHLRARDAAFWEGEAAGLLPSDTFDDDYVIEIGGKTVRLIHPGRGHTDGDLIAIFEEDGVVHMGDLYFNDFYPNIDLEAGGSVRAWIETLDRVLELPFERAISGHGATTDREGIRAFQDFLRELWSVGEQAASEGMSLEYTLETAKLVTSADYGVIGVPLIFSLDRDFVVRRAWEEATGTVVADAP
jgi:glyoxylase-like metal-dependent hydrolase (beta-lactamase superfamily II)